MYQRLLLGDSFFFVLVRYSSSGLAISQTSILKSHHFFLTSKHRDTTGHTDEEAIWMLKFSYVRHSRSPLWDASRSQGPPRFKKIYVFLMQWWLLYIFRIYAWRLDERPFFEVARALWITAGATSWNTILRVHESWRYPPPCPKGTTWGALRRTPDGPRTPLGFPLRLQWPPKEMCLQGLFLRAHVDPFKTRSSPHKHKWFLFGEYYQLVMSWSANLNSYKTEKNIMTRITRRITSV